MEKELLSCTDVCSIICVSERTLYKDFKKCIPKLEQNKIDWSGKGKNRLFFKDSSESIDKISYDIFREIILNVWNFNPRTDLKKLLSYMMFIYNHQNDDHIITCENISKSINISLKTLRKYKNTLIKNKIIMPKNLSKLEIYVTTVDSTSFEKIPNNIYSYFLKSNHLEDGTEILNKFKKEFNYNNLCILLKTDFTPNFMHNEFLICLLHSSYVYINSHSNGTFA